MKTTITIAGNPHEIICNLGTEQLYRHLTGHDFNLDLSNIEAAAKSESQAERRKAAGELLEMTKALAFIMTTQAKTSEDITKLFAMMNQAEYMKWLFDFNPGDFTMETYKQIISCWQKTRETSVPAKN